MLKLAISVNLMASSILSKKQGITKKKKKKKKGFPLKPNDVLWCHSMFINGQANQGPLYDINVLFNRSLEKKDTLSNS